MSAKHTPGPWQISGYYNNGCGVSNGVQGVASVYGIGDAEAKANGLLVSAAPALLDALHQMLNWVEADQLNSAESFPAVDQALAAIAKATGSES